VQLGQLAGQHDLPPGAAVSQEILQGLLQAMGGFVENDGALFLGQLLQTGLSLAGFERQKPLEDKPPCGQPRSSQSGHCRYRARHRDHRDPSLDTGAHQFLSWIGDGGCAGIAD